MLFGHLVTGNWQSVFCIQHLQIGSSQQEKGHLQKAMQSVCTVCFVLTDQSVLTDWTDRLECLERL